MTCKYDIGNYSLHIRPDKKSLNETKRKVTEAYCNGEDWEKVLKDNPVRIRGLRVIEGGKNDQS
jgi:hypothetical protein